MDNRYDPVKEIDFVKQEFYEYKNPIYDKERWFKLNETIFDTEEHLKQTLDGKQDNLEDNSPVDEDWYVNIHRFFDPITGKLDKDYFKTIKTHSLGNKIYHEVYVPNTECRKQFLLDFANKKCFSALPKWTSHIIQQIDTFWWKDILILHWWMDETHCITWDGKQIWDKCLNIKKIKYGNIDILEFKSRINPNYEVNDLRTKFSYLWSDGFMYKRTETPTKDWTITVFEKITNELKELKTIIVEDNKDK